MTKRQQIWLLLRAHVMGDLQSLHDIAGYYASAVSDGLLPQKYSIKAFRYYEYGAMKGHPGCQYDFGFMLLTGHLGKKDKERGLVWIKRAADGGYLSAQDFLADYPQSE